MSQTSPVTETLLPCPLCQSASNTLWKGFCFVGESDDREDAVRCPTCGCRATLKAWQSRGHAQTPDHVQKLETENAALRAFAESFHVTVVDNFYQDATLVLEQPHTLAIRLRNDSTKSWIFADFEARRKAALSDTSTDSEGDVLCKYYGTIRQRCSKCDCTHPSTTGNSK